jgi:hypothetical protein
LITAKLVKRNTLPPTISPGKKVNKNYVNGMLHGAEKSYYQSGKLRSLGYFKRGILDGIVTGYYEDGTIQVREHTTTVLSKVELFITILMALNK